MLKNISTNLNSKEPMMITGRIVRFSTDFFNKLRDRTPEKVKSFSYLKGV